MNPKIKIFVIVGLIFIPIGALIIVASKGVLEYSQNYTSCQAKTFWFQNDGNRPDITLLRYYLYLYSGSFRIIPL